MDNTLSLKQSHNAHHLTGGKMKTTTILLLFIYATLLSSCMSDNSNTYLSYSTPDSAPTDLCDGPCETIIVDACRLMYTSDTMVFATVLDKPVFEEINPYEGNKQPYKSSYYRIQLDVKWQAVEGQKLVPSPIDVILFTDTFDKIPQKGESILIGLRADQQEWFSLVYLYAQMHDKQVSTNSQQSDDDISIQLPDESRALIKALTHARNEFATACTHVIDARMDDAEFKRIVRGN